MQGGGMWRAGPWEAPSSPVTYAPVVTNSTSYMYIHVHLRLFILRTITSSNVGNQLSPAMSIVHSMPCGHIFTHGMGQ